MKITLATYFDVYCRPDGLIVVSNLSGNF